MRMTVGGMDLNLLGTLQVLLEEENVTHAGARLGLSQPSMSIALAKLRRHYDDELLVRDGRYYRLTPLARALLPEVAESLRLTGAAFRRNEAFAPETSERAFKIILSDYAINVLSEPLIRRVRERAPGVTLTLQSPIPPDMPGSDRWLREYDMLIGPAGFGFPGESAEIFRDRFVCITAPDNPRLQAGRLSLEDLSALPHAVAAFGHATPTPAERVLEESGVRRRIRVAVSGWLPLAFVVSDSDLVAIVPERMARQIAEPAGVVIVEPPFGRVELIEAAWWDPAQRTDPAIGWLQSILRETAAQLATAL